VDLGLRWLARLRAYVIDVGAGQRTIPRDGSAARAEGDVKGNVDTVLAFLMSRDFAVNFVANLFGALFGVSLAFSLERVRVRRDATSLYGRVLRTSRSELAFLKTGCEFDRDPRWTPENRPVVDGAKPASGSAAPSTSLLPRSLPFEQAAQCQEAFRSL
jgi:hypothetical protein